MSVTDRMTECKPIVPPGFTGGGLKICLPNWKFFNETSDLMFSMPIVSLSVQGSRSTIQVKVVAMVSSSVQQVMAEQEDCTTQ